MSAKLEMDVFFSKADAMAIKPSRPHSFSPMRSSAVRFSAVISLARDLAFVMLSLVSAGKAAHKGAVRTDATRTA